MVEGKINPGDMPALWEDKHIAGPDVSGLMFWDGWRFAYPNLAILAKWWGESKDWCTERGMKIQVIDVPESVVALYAQQVVYPASEGKVTKTLTFQEGLDALSQGS